MYDDECRYRPPGIQHIRVAQEIVYALRARGQIASIANLAAYGHIWPTEEYYEMLLRDLQNGYLNCHDGSWPDNFTRQDADLICVSLLIIYNDIMTRTMRGESEELSDILPEIVPELNPEEDDEGEPN